MSETPDEWLRTHARRGVGPAVALRLEVTALRRYVSYVANLGEPDMERLRLGTAVEDLIRLAREVGWGPGRPGLENDGGEAESEAESRAGTAGEAPTKVPSELV